MSEITAGGWIWRILALVIFIAVLLLSRRPTLAQRSTEAIGVLSLAGALWTLIILNLPAAAPFVVGAAIAFGLLANAEARSES